MLHAALLNLSHPVSGEALSIHAPLPKDFHSILHKLKS
jgi:23S rRNA-/tRNA-specific pseudouridylate synthase